MLIRNSAGWRLIGIAAVSITAAVALARAEGDGGTRGQSAVGSGRAAEAVVGRLPAASARQQMARVLAAAGRGAVADIASAQQALSKHDTELARRLLQRAKALVGEIGAAMARRGAASDVPVAVRIAAKDQVVGPGAGDGNGPADLPADTVAGLERDILLGRQDAVVAALDATGQALTYRQWSLPIAPTAAAIEQALTDIDAGDAEAAAKRLRTALDGLIATTISIGPDAEHSETLAASPHAPQGH